MPSTAFEWLTRRPWLLPGLVTVVIGAAGITRPGLWADELATWGAVSLSWPDLGRLLANTDAVNGGYYLVMKAWTGLAGTGHLALRLPALLAMAVAAGGVASLGSRLRTPTWGMAAGCCFAVLPVTSRYAQEARSYALVIALAVLASLLLARLRDRSGLWGWIGYGACIAGLGVFHLLGLLVLVAHGVTIAVWRARLWKAWLVTTAAAVVVLSPLLVLGLEQRGQTSWIAPLSWHGLSQAPKALFGSQWTAVLVVLLVTATMIAARDKASATTAVWAVTPVAALAVVSAVVNLWFPRYLLFTVPAWILLAMSAVVRRRIVAAAVVLAVAVSGLGAQWDIRRGNGHGHDTLGAAAVIADGFRPGDGFAVALDEPVVPWEARDLVARYVPAERRPVDVFATASQRFQGRFLATECAELAGCLADTPRLWIIRFENPPDPLDGIGTEKEALLRKNFSLTAQWPLRGLTVALLDRRIPEVDALPTGRRQSRGITP